MDVGAELQSWRGEDASPVYDLLMGPLFAQRQNQKWKIYWNESKLIGGTSAFRSICVRLRLLLRTEVIRLQAIGGTVQANTVKPLGMKSG